MSILINLPLAERQALLLEHSEWLIKQAEAKGASAVKIAARANSTLHVQTRLMQLENIEYNQNQGVSIQVYYGKSVGSASCNFLEKNALAAALDAACVAAKFIEPDPFAGLPESATLVDPHHLPDLDLYHPCELEVEQILACCQAIEQAGFAYHTSVINSEGASFSASQTLDALVLKAAGANQPFIVAQPDSHYSMGCTLIAGKDSNHPDKQTGSWFDQAVNHHKLMAADSLGVIAAKHAVNALGARTLKTTKLPVLFASDMAMGFWNYLLKAISGKRIYEKTSFLNDALGKMIFPDNLSLIEQPFIIQGMGSAAFDAEGVATRHKRIIDKGQLTTYLLSSYTGRMLNLPSTGNAGGVYNLMIEAPTQPVKDIIKQMDKGLLVTDLMGQGVNLVTGNYSQGASGYWIEDGEICFPVHEFTVAGNLKDLFKQMVAFGDDIDKRTSIRTGSVLIESMQIAGTS